MQNPQTAGELLVNSGYSVKTAREPKQVLDSKGFQELLGQIDDKEILNRFYMILRDSDKRSSLAAGIELLKLKDRYPKEETKFTSLFTSIKAISKDSGEKEND